MDSELDMGQLPNRPPCLSTTRHPAKTSSLNSTLEKSAPPLNVGGVVREPHASRLAAPHSAPAARGRSSLVSDAMLVVEMDTV